MLSLNLIFLNAMALAYFFVEDLDNESIVLDEDTSKHVTQVLRMKEGSELMLTNGKGAKAKAVIVDENRKRCKVKITDQQYQKPHDKKVSIAISLIKNTSRFEWFLEKATEISVTEIIPLICDRTEKQSFRYDRMQNILVSAMLQSQQCWLPVLHEAIQFEKFITNNNAEKKFIAHCKKDEKQFLKAYYPFNHQHSVILIGPEGDFTENEIQLALENNYLPVSLGDTRLRTETAGMVSAVLLRMAFD